MTASFTHDFTFQSCSPSTVGTCQTVHLPSLYDPYTAKIREIYIATVMNDASMASFRHHALQPRPVPPFRPGLSAYAEAFTSHGQLHWLARYSLTSVVRICDVLMFTFWWSNLNIAILLDYKWSTKLIFLPNVLPVYSEMALKCIYFALITHMMTWPWRSSNCSMLKLKHAWEMKSVWK